MKYLLPLVVFLAVAGAPPARAEFSNCGPFLDEQMDQAKQSAIYERVLKKGQQDQADQSALYEKTLEKEEKTQAQQSAIYEKELGKEQVAQAKQSAEYEKVLAKEMTEQAKQSAVYAKQLSDSELAWRKTRYKLCAEQSKKMQALSNKMFDDTRLAAEPKPAAATPGTAAAPPPSNGTTKPAPLDMNALKDKKPDLLKALKDIDEGK